MTKLLFQLLVLVSCIAILSFDHFHVWAVTTSYHIGNSLTFDSQPLALEGFAESRGFQHEVGYHIRSASSLEDILANPTDTSVSPNEFGVFSEALPNHHWDVVTLQTHNGPTSTLGTDVDAILSLINMTRSNPSNAQTNFYIYQSWPEISGNYQHTWNQPSLNELTTPSIQRKEYFNNVLERVRDATNANVYMVPVGDVLYELDVRARAGKIPGYNSVNSFYRDSLHLRSDIGRFVASATTFATVLGQYPNELEKPEGFFELPDDFVPRFNLSPVQKALILETIRDVLDKHPYSGVQMPLPLRADFNGDGRVDDFDLTMWQRSQNVTEPYDMDYDGDVDGRDFLNWQRSYSHSLSPSHQILLDQVDLNGDGALNDLDEDVWRESYGTDSDGDIDGDGDTDGRDFLIWQRTPSGLEGDINRDFLIDSFELDAWTNSFGFDARTDANQDGVVDFEDYSILNSEFGREWTFPFALVSPLNPGGVSTLGVVPEPGTFLSSAVALLSLLLRR
jgi:hypothetical protein